jgi:hypothetical protein
MGLFLRITGVFIVLVGLLAGVSLARPAWMEDMGMDFWNLPGVSKSLVQEQSRKSQLDQSAQRVSAEAQTKDTIVRDLIDERIDLTEAVNQLYHCATLNDIRDGIAGMELPGATEDERMARMLIFWVGEELREEPERAARVIRRLEGQLRDQIQEPEV